eukprot:TRINITY_DN7140_c1_g1_i1.p1 TRINITY_DN7140_c1_g1~~TRINITY_DN7140_c1_g1_i1.p1  ORF type:complete len:1506 (+),score=301.40 TRINITY_DN7140_c1_g1_i1:26-4543(+)
MSDSEEQTKRTLLEELYKAEKKLSKRVAKLDEILGNAYTIKLFDEYIAECCNRFLATMKRANHLLQTRLIQLVGAVEMIEGNSAVQSNLITVAKSKTSEIVELIRSVLRRERPLLRDFLSMLQPTTIDDSLLLKEHKFRINLLERLKRRLRKEEVAKCWTIRDIHMNSAFLSLFYSDTIKKTAEPSITVLSDEVGRRMYNFMKEKKNFNFNEIDVTEAVRYGKGSVTLISNGARVTMEDGKITNTHLLLFNPPLLDTTTVVRMTQFRKLQDFVTTIEEQYKAIESKLFDINLLTLDIVSIVNGKETIDSNIKYSEDFVVKTEEVEKDIFYYKMNRTELEEFSIKYRCMDDDTRKSIGEYVTKIILRDTIIGEVKVDLSHQDLSNINLRNIDLRGVSFDYCDLSHANLSGADLRGVSFVHTNLYYCNMENTQLANANFYNTNLAQIIGKTCIREHRSYKRQKHKDDIAVKRVAFCEKQLTILEKLFKNQTISNTEKRGIIDRVIEWESVKQKLSTFQQPHALSPENILINIVNKEGIISCNFNDSQIDEAFKVITSFQSKVILMQTIIKVKEELLGVLDEIVVQSIIQKKHEFIEKRKIERNTYFQYYRDLFNENIVSLREKKRKEWVKGYISNLSDKIDEWYEELNPAYRSIDLTKVNGVENLDFSDLNLRYVKLTADQLSRIRGLNKLSGIDKLLLEEAINLKVNMAISMLSKSKNVINDCVRVINSSEALYKLHCDSEPPNLDNVDDEGIRVATYLAVISSSINSLPLENPLSSSYVISLSLTEFIERPVEDLKKDLMTVLEARKFKLSEEIVALVRCSRMSSLYNNIHDSAFLALSDSENILADIPIDKQTPIISLMKELKSKKKSVSERKDDLILEAEKHYVKMLIKNLNGPPDDIYGGSPDSRLSDALELARNKPQIVIDIRGVDVSKLTFESLNLNNINLQMTKDQLKCLGNKQLTERAEKFRKTIESGDLFKVKKQMDMGIDLEQKDKFGLTPLFTACINYHYHIVVYLLDCNASLEATNNDGLNILEYLCYSHVHGQKAIIRNLLVEHLTKVRKQEISLHCAVALGRLQMVKNFIINEGCDVNHIDTKSKKSPLHLAVEFDHQEIAALLVKLGANKNALCGGSIRLTPLQICCIHGRISIIQLLISYDTDLGITDSSNRSLVNIALENNFISLARLLVDFGAPVKIEDALRLSYIPAIKRRIKQSIDEDKQANAQNSLIQRAMTDANAEKAKVGINKLISQGNSLLHLATEIGNTEMVEWLLSEGAFPDVVNSNGKIPLQIACEKGYSQIAKLLIQSSKRSYTKTKLQEMNFNCLFAAVNGGHVETVKTLLDAGTDPNIVHNQSCLSRAINIGRVDVVKELIDHGASAITSDNLSNTPIHLASMNGNLSILSTLLISYLQLKNFDNKSPLDLWPKEMAASLDLLITPLQRVSLVETCTRLQPTPLFEHNDLKLPHNVSESIFSYLDKRTLESIVPCVSYNWLSYYYKSTGQLPKLKK